jgi:hypothetical protein
MIAQLVEQFIALSEEIRDRRRPFAVCGAEEGYGYERTALEVELAGCLDELGRLLQADPHTLTGKALEQILLAMFNCAPAIGTDRVRLVAYGGDYGVVTSPVSSLMAALMAAINEALKRLAAEKSFPLAEVDKNILLKNFSIYKDGAAGSA